MSGSSADATLECRIRDVMTQVIDPELGIDVVSLGMLGPISVGEGKAIVKMRLTSMSCPFWELFVEQVKSALMTVEGVREVVVEWDHSTSWTPELMSEPARSQLERVGLMPPRFVPLQPEARRDALRVLPG